jgi:hypothetical protein
VLAFIGSIAIVPACQAAALIANHIDGALPDLPSLGRLHSRGPGPPTVLPREARGAGPINRRGRAVRAPAPAPLLPE